METPCAPAPYWPRIEKSAANVEGWFGRLVERHADCEEASPGELRDITTVIGGLARLVNARKSIEGWKLKLIEHKEKSATAKGKEKAVEPAATKTTITLVPHIYEHLKKSIEAERAEARLHESGDTTTSPANQKEGTQDDHASGLE